MSTKISKDQIDEYYGKPDQAPQMLNEAPVNVDGLEHLNEQQREALNRHYGIGIPTKPRQTLTERFTNFFKG